MNEREYNMAIFSACLQQESVNFCVHFQKSRFFRKTQQESVNFYHHFLVDGRVGLGRFVAFRRRPKIKKRLKNHTFIVIGNDRIELLKWPFQSDVFSRKLSVSR